MFSRVIKNGKPSHKFVNHKLRQNVRTPVGLERPSKKKIKFQ